MATDTRRNHPWAQGLDERHSPRSGESIAKTEADAELLKDILRHLKEKVEDAILAAAEEQSSLGNECHLHAPENSFGWQIIRRTGARQDLARPAIGMGMDIIRASFTTSARATTCAKDATRTARQQRPMPWSGPKCGKSL